MPDDDTPEVPTTTATPQSPAALLAELAKAQEARAESIDEHRVSEPESPSIDEAPSIPAVPRLTSFQDLLGEPDDTDEDLSLDMPDKEPPVVPPPVSPPPTEDRHLYSEGVHTRIRTFVHDEEQEDNDDSGVRPALEAHTDDTFRIGILGGRNSGKSFLFQSMVYRTSNTANAGCLSSMLAGVARLYRGAGTTARQDWRFRSTDKYLDDYMSWRRLETTLLEPPEWHRLVVDMKTGFLGRGRQPLEIQFLDAPGEWISQTEGHDAERSAVWKTAYVDARVLVFCLPIWALFPAPGAVDREDQAHEVKQFLRAVHNIVAERARHKVQHRTEVVLALTMADDPRSALTAVRTRWIEPYTKTWRGHRKFLKLLSRGRGISRYLAHARALSNALDEQIASLPNQMHAQIPAQIALQQPGVTPWIIPMSAVDGTHLDDPDDAKPESPPMPVHVELPILLSMSVQFNALM